jgi:predicted oxidoreductase (fatty acid repression mutant protein)
MADSIDVFDLFQDVILWLKTFPQWATRGNNMCTVYMWLFLLLFALFYLFVMQVE